MSGTTVTASTSVVLVPTSSNYTRPYIVTFPNISTTGRLITVRDNDGFVSTGNSIVLSTTTGTTFNGMGDTITITQPYGFITLASQANGSYSILNTFAFPAGQAAANVSNLNAQVVNIQSTLNMYDFGTMSTNTIYTSSGQFIFNGDYIGQVTDEQLASTVTNLGTTGYLSSIPFVYVVPPTWIAVGQSSTISQATSSGSIQYSSNDANWSNAIAGKGFTKFGTAVTYGEGYYIAVGNNDDGLPNTGYNQWSFNGRDWYYSYAPFLSSVQVRTACLYANGLYHSVGCNDGVGGPNTILYSEDGKTWQPSTGNPFFTTDGTGYATGIAFGSGNGYAGVWVCSGVQNQGSAASLLWSSDGSNWNPSVNPMPFGSGGVMDVTFDGNKFVALCMNGTTDGGFNVCISLDGSNWFGSNITGGNFANQPRYVTGSNGVFVATTGNPGQSLVYSLDGGNSWQSNTNLSGCNLPMYKPYYDGLKWWVGVETTGGAQSMFYSTESAPALSTWTNAGFTGGFLNGGIARAFTSTDGQSNVTAILNSTIFGLSQTFTTSNFNASTISAGKAYVGELNASTLYIGVTFVSTTYETVNNISTQNVDFISVGSIVGGPARFRSLSTNTISSGTAYIGQGLNLTGGVSYGSLKISGGETNTIFIQDGATTTPSNFSGYQVGITSAGSQPSTLMIMRLDEGTQQLSKGIFLTQQGRVGINTTTPQYTLDVNGITRIQGASHLWNDVNIYTTSNEISATNGLIRMTTQGGISYIQSGSNGVSTNNKLYFTGIGNADSKFTMDMVNTRMGIGNDSPQTTLDVTGTELITQFTTATTSDNPTLRLNNAPGSNRSIQFYTNMTAGAYLSNITAAGDMGLIFTEGTKETGNLVIGPWNDSLYGIRITSNGRVGINTPFPAETFDINGVLNLRAGTAQSTPNVDPANKSNTYIVFGEAGTANDFAMLRQIGGSDAYHMTLDLHDDDGVNYSIRKVRSSASSDTIQTLFTIDGANSRVGIMTDSPQYALDVNGSVWARSTLYVGSNTTINQIRFYGTNLDGPGQSNGPFTHTVIGEYLYGGTEQSELILFKGDNNATSSGPDRVRVLAAGGFRVDIGGTSQDFIWPQGSNPPNALYQNALFVSGSNGNVGIGKDNPSQALDVSGNIYASGDITAGSDFRFKTMINTIENPLSTLTQLRGVTYHLKNTSTPTRKVGVIAQEVEQVLPEVVTTDDSPDQFKAVAYGNMVGLLIEAVKELSAKVDILMSNA